MWPILSRRLKQIELAFGCFDDRLPSAHSAPDGKTRPPSTGPLVMCEQVQRVAVTHGRRSGMNSRPNGCFGATIFRNCFRQTRSARRIHFLLVQSCITTLVEVSTNCRKTSSPWNACSALSSNNGVVGCHAPDNAHNPIRSRDRYSGHQLFYGIEPVL